MPGPPPEERPTPSRRARFLRGARLGMPVFLGYMPIGAAWGILATLTGFTVFQAISCSALVLAGAGQFITVNVLASKAGLAGVLLATGVVNLRYVLFGATLAPYLRHTPRTLQVPLAFTLTDETFGINVTDCRAGSADNWSMLGVGAISWTGWVLGTAVGALGASLIGDPTTWGIEFAMPAMFTALLVAQITGKRYLVAGMVAAATSVALTPVLPGWWPVMLGSMAAATVMTVSTR